MKLNNLLLLLRRLLAFLYDSLLLFALFFAVTTVALFLNDGRAIESILYKIALIPVAACFYIWFWIHGGQTLGMRAWRIKLINNDKTELTLRKCLLRFVLGLLTFGISFIFIVFDKQGRTLHDRLSNTSIKNDNINK